MDLTEVAIPIIPSRSIDQTVVFYERLGFSAKVFQEAGYAILKRGTVEIHFFTHPELIPAESYSGCYIRVPDADEMYQSFVSAGLPSRGIPRLTPPEDKPWGMREFALVDGDGNLVRVGHGLVRNLTR